MNGWRFVCTEKDGLFGKSDPYFVILKQYAKTMNLYNQVYTSEIVPKTLSPVWDEVTIELATLCEGNANLPLKIQVADHDKDQEPDYIGSVDTAVARLVAGASFPIINESKREKKSKYTDSGILNVLTAERTSRRSFLEYMAGGAQLDLTIALDASDIADDGDFYSDKGVYVRLARVLSNQLCFFIPEMKARLVAYNAICNLVDEDAYPIVDGDDAKSTLKIDEISPAIQNAFSKTINARTGLPHLKPLLERTIARTKTLQQVGNAPTFSVLVVLTRSNDFADFKEAKALIDDNANLPIAPIMVSVGNSKWARDKGNVWQQHSFAACDYRTDTIATLREAAVHSFLKDVFWGVSEKYIAHMTENKIVPAQPSIRITAGVNNWKEEWN